jgi:hypothetical protein
MLFRRNHLSAIALAVLLPVFVLAKEPDVRLERVAVPTGAEILTVIAVAPDKTEVPLLSVLRDTLGDPDPHNDRLRSVWILTAARPSLTQRIAAAVPFFYFRRSPGSRADTDTGAVLDLANASRSVWTSFAQALTQVLALDRGGALIRTSSRHYRTNVADRRRAQLVQGRTALAMLEERPELRAEFSEAELLEIEARLTLASQTMGGLVTDQKLPDAYWSRRNHVQETRGHNWELLRQQAEINGLYFQWLGMGDSPTHALIWIACEDLGSERDFNGQFLGIRNPFTDTRLRGWSGIRATRWYDSTGREVTPGTPDAIERELIPLALYALDYPKVPLLLVDFRDAHAAKRREMFGHAMDDVVTGVLGISGWGNWPYLAGSLTWNFLRTRHGAPTDNARRLEAYSAVRGSLAMDHSLDPALRLELQRRLEAMAVNPLEGSVFAEPEVSRRRYAALLSYAADPQGLAARLEADRASELLTYKHSPLARAGLTAAMLTSFALYRHSEREGRTDLVTVLNDQRRASRELHFLETVASSPQPELVWNMAEVGRARDALTSTALPPRTAKTLGRLLTHTPDDQRAAVNSGLARPLAPAATAE